MRRARIWTVVLGGLLAVAGAVTPVLLAIGGQGLPVNEIAIGLVVVAYTVVAAVVTLARPGQLVGQLTWCGAVAWGVGEGLLALGVRGLEAPGSVPAAAWLGTLGTAVRGLGWLTLVLAVPLVFPDGKAPWPGRRTPAVVVSSAVALFTAASLLAPTPLEFRLEGVDSPTGLPADLAPVADVLALVALALSVVALATAVAGLAHRWRRADELQRQQLTWFGAAFAVPLLFLPFIWTDLVEPWMFALVTLPVPVAVGVALLQRRLYDIQLVVSRTLTYAALSAAVAGLYAVTVGGVGALLQERGAPWLAWVAAGVVAVSFAPLRNALQQGVNRLTYGQWAQPADVLAATGRRLADASDVPALLTTITTELAEGLGLRYVEIVDMAGRPLGRHGSATAGTESIALMTYGAPVGRLHWSGQRLRAADRALLDDVARQLGAVVHAATLLDAVRAAQERLVLAGEEERRRLRRDLHDGLGPSLASLTLQVDRLRNQAGMPGIDLDAELLRLRSGIQTTVADVRRVVEGLRPPALDELGLETALEQLVARVAGATGLPVTVDVD
ncbi:MAG TPA: histidine kinase, partial [Actinomycetales bacterium]|nr:histidine kinase [Actinomycetales bacterium]